MALEDADYERLSRMAETLHSIDDGNLTIAAIDKMLQFIEGALNVAGVVTTVRALSSVLDTIHENLDDLMESEEYLHEVMNMHRETASSSHGA